MSNNTNLYRALRELLPEPPLMVAESVQAHVDGTSTVSYPGGSWERVRGNSGAVGHKVFVRNGVIEGDAADLTAVTIDV